MYAAKVHLPRYRQTRMPHIDAVNRIRIHLKKRRLTIRLPIFVVDHTLEEFPNKTQFLRRRDGETFNSDCVVQNVKHPTKLMIWSVISGRGTGRLDVVKGMMRQDQYKMSCKIA
ncbi:uncharacterized protein TNCV_1044681 [Trichonephila clavipes]|nr:uncharacterized protein TNCV_1044681 [Trichonephila clavipes]